MSMRWTKLGSLTSAALLRAVQSGSFTITSLVITVVAASAQESPTPSAQSYRGTTQAQSYQGAFADLANQIDNFWEDTFTAEDLDYRSPNIVAIEGPMATGCEPTGLHDVAFYCPADQTIYLNPLFLAAKEKEIGDYAPITVLAHEWGHHVQVLTHTPNPGGSTFELQADCLAGVYTQHAAEHGLLDPGDVSEAVMMSESVGDSPVVLPQDNPDLHEHGTNDDRITAFMRGYLMGLNGCDHHVLSDEARRSSVTPQLVPTHELMVRTPTPTPRPAQLALPTDLPLPHASCFGIVDDGDENFEQVLGRFSGVADARSRLQSWGWQASAFRQFGCDGPPEGEAGYIDISVHRFADASSAQEAVDYFTVVRLDGSPYVQGASPGLGDYSTAMSGPAVNGKDFTVYASQGPLLIRVTGVSPSGIPFMNVLTVANAVLGSLQAAPQGVPTQPVQESLRPASSYLPAVPGVHYRECFDVLTQGTYSYSEVAGALVSTGLFQSEFDGLGWRDGAYVVFACSDPPFGRASQIDVVIHHFGDSQSAEYALPYVAGTYDPGQNESRSCDTAGSMVVCVTGKSLTGSPLSDVAFVLQQVMAGIS